MLKTILVNYLKCMATGVLLVIAFPMVVVFFRLFFYETWSWQQVLTQGGIQFLLATLVYFIAAAIHWVWSWTDDL